MKIQIEVNGKKLDAYVNDNEMTAALKPQKTGYERAKINEIYYYECSGIPVKDEDREFIFDEDMYKSGNYYTDCNVAKNNVRADTLMRQLRRFSAEHGGCPSHKTYQRIAFEIVINNEGRLCARTVYSNYVGNILFITEDAAKEAIDTFHDELIWYFTEYNPMLEGWIYEPREKENE